MKKNKLFRLLTVALTLVFLCLLAVPAFAATSDPWSDGSYTYYLVTSVFSNATTRSNAATSTTTIYHSYGSNTNMTGYYDMKSTEDWLSVDYGNEVIATAAKDGLDNTHTQNNMYMTDLTTGIPNYKASGQYYVKANTVCYGVGYDVYQEDMFGSSIILTSGAVYAPYGVSDQITGYKAK